jgi:hypothetical protein
MPNSRMKGKRGELEAIGVFKDNGWPDAERTSNGRTQNGRNDMANGPAGVAVEIKYVEKLNVPKALDQLVADSDPLDIPLLVHRPSRHVWMATLPLTDLLPLLALRERGL